MKSDNCKSPRQKLVLAISLGRAGRKGVASPVNQRVLDPTGPDIASCASCGIWKCDHRQNQPKRGKHSDSRKRGMSGMMGTDGELGRMNEYFRVHRQTLAG